MMPRVDFLNDTGCTARMAGVKTYVCIVACMVRVGCGQLTFPGASTTDALSAASSSSTPSQPAAGDPPHDVPQRHPGQTRLFGLDGLLGAVFGDECDRCSVRDQVLANRCCQQGHRHCCQFLQPVVGFVRPPVRPGFGQPGVPGGFQPGVGSFQPGPPGFVPGGASTALISGTGLSGVEKPGVCPDGTKGVQSGFNRFVGAQCVQQCRADVHCTGIQKCCNIGCSTACQAPRGVGVQGFPGSGFQAGGGFISGGAGGFPVGGGFVQSTTKAGFCPRKINPITHPVGAISSLFGFRSGTSADIPTATSHAHVDDITGAEGRSINNGKDARREARRQVRQEKRQNSRTQRSAFKDEDEAMKHKQRGLTRFSKPRNRILRSAISKLSVNPLHGAIQDSEEDVFERHRQQRQRQRRQSDNEQLQSDVPNPRFFGPFCRDHCFNDFHCPGNLKCCTEQLGDCMDCVNPQLF